MNPNLQKNREPDLVLRLYDDTGPLGEDTEALREIVSQLDAMPQARPDAAVLDRIEAAAAGAARVRAHRAPVIHRIVRAPVFRYALAACLVLAVVVGVLARLNDETPAQARTAPVVEDVPAWDQRDDLYTITRRLDELQEQYEELGWDEPAVPLESFGAGTAKGQAPVGFRR